VGFTKRHLEEVQARGWIDTESIVCSACVSDKALVAAVINHGGRDTCSFCGGESGSSTSAPLELVLELVVSGIHFEYEDPIEQSAYDSEDGYLVPTWDTWDLLEELEVSDRPDVLGAVARAVSRVLWCQRDPYAVTPTQALEWGWQSFRQFVKERRRYTFLVPDPTTADGAGSLAMNALPAAIASAVASAGLVTTLPPGSRWWRARVDADGQRFSHAQQIGAPPTAHARDNRMSPKGIGVFYGASMADGAVAEVAGYAIGSAMLSVGRFHVVDSIQVVDLREVPSVPSLFDRENRELRAPITFFRSFIEDISTPSPPADLQNCPIENILIVGRSCDLLTLNKFWTRPSVGVQKDLRVSDKIHQWGLGLWSGKAVATAPRRSVHRTALDPAVVSQGPHTITGRKLDRRNIDRGTTRHCQTACVDVHSHAGRRHHLDTAERPAILVLHRRRSADRLPDQRRGRAPARHAALQPTALG
jgi:hypothetical protein